MAASKPLALDNQAHTRLSQVLQLQCDPVIELLRVSNPSWKQMIHITTSDDKTDLHSHEAFPWWYSVSVHSNVGSQSSAVISCTAAVSTVCIYTEGIYWSTSNCHLHLSHLFSAKSSQEAAENPLIGVSTHTTMPLVSAGVNLLHTLRVILVIAAGQQSWCRKHATEGQNKYGQPCKVLSFTNQ